MWFYLEIYFWSKNVHDLFDIANRWQAFCWRISCFVKVATNREKKKMNHKPCEQKLQIKVKNDFERFATSNFAIMAFALKESVCLQLFCMVPKVYRDEETACGEST